MPRLPVSSGDWLFLAAGVMMVVVGVYILSAPRRLFMREEDPAEYRPEAVEHDSEHGRWLRKVVAPGAVIAGLVLILNRLL